MATATLTRWVLWSWSPYATVEAVGVPDSVKRPLERRVWYEHFAPTSVNTYGLTSQTSLMARVLDDGTAQRSQASYNGLAHVTWQMDAVGRQTTYTYATNGIDLLEVRQLKPGGADDFAKLDARRVHRLREPRHTHRCEGPDDDLGTGHAGSGDAGAAR